MGSLRCDQAATELRRETHAAQGPLGLSPSESLLALVEAASLRLHVCYLLIAVCRTFLSAAGDVCGSLSCCVARVSYSVIVIVIAHLSLLRFSFCL